jgi:hypothetical protein
VAIKSDLARTLGISASEVHAAISRGKQARLVRVGRCAAAIGCDPIVAEGSPVTSLNNEAMLAIVARRLGSLKDEIVFPGGATVSLFLTDPAAAEVRATAKVDGIVATSLSAYESLGKRLRSAGFREDTRSEGQGNLDVHVVTPPHFLATKIWFLLMHLHRVQEEDPVSIPSPQFSAHALTRSPTPADSARSIALPRAAA